MIQNSSSQLNRREYSLGGAWAHSPSAACCRDEQLAVAAKDQVSWAESCRPTPGPFPANTSKGKPPWVEFLVITSVPRPHVTYSCRHNSQKQIDFQESLPVELRHQAQQATWELMTQIRRQISLLKSRSLSCPVLLKGSTTVTICPFSLRWQALAGWQVWPGVPSNLSDLRRSRGPSTSSA